MNLVTVDVDTQEGTAYLSGEVDTMRHKAWAEQITQKVQGVIRVVNKLTVRD